MLLPLQQNNLLAGSSSKVYAKTFTRLGLYGATRAPYGSFSGKTTYVPPASKPYTKVFTRLGLYGSTRMPYGSFAGKTSFIPVTPPTTGGRGRRRRRRYLVEIDGQYFEVNSIAQAEAILQQVREVAEESAERDVTTTEAPKPPRVTVKTGSGKPTTSKVIQREVKRTQRVINRAYKQAAQRLQIDLEISHLLHMKLRAEEDEEEALIALLL